MMHQENWMAMMMMSEQTRNELIRESNNRRMVNCCKKMNPIIIKLAVPIFNHFQLESLFSRPAIFDIID
ncbi:MAG: hypothetical protein JEZ00_21480 [Anaerolineaceae bacterium]|nr:hypothetical protein [Anaerolineaceae bacterium]